MLSFSDVGETDAPPLVIVHGLFGSGRNWGVIAKRLSDSARVITPDLRNHGSSPQSPQNGYTDLAGDLAEVIDHIGGPVDMIGHSMGGKAAMMLAITQPDRIKRLVVADIAPVSYTHTQMRYIEAMLKVDLSGVTRRSDAEAQLAALGVEPALCSFFTQSLDISGKRWRYNLSALASEMPKILSFPDIDSSFDGPALFLSGAASSYVTVDARPRIKHLFPAAQFAKLPGAGHWLHADKPREFEAAVRVFLSTG